MAEAKTVHAQASSFREFEFTQSDENHEAQFVIVRNPLSY